MPAPDFIPATSTTPSAPPPFISASSSGGGWGDTTTAPAQASSSPPPPFIPTSSSGGGWGDTTTTAPAATPTAPPAPAQPKNFLGRIDDWIEREAGKDPDSARGAGVLREVIGQTGGLAKLSRMIPGIDLAMSDEDKARRDQYIQQMQDMGKARSPEEAQGKFMAGIAEWLTGEEALKGLSYAEKVKQILPFMEQLEKYPKIARMVSSGISAGTIFGTQRAADTGSPVEGAKGAGLGLGLGMGGEYVAPYISAGVSRAGELTKAATAALKDAWSPEVIQLDLQNGIRNVFNQAATDEGMSLEQPQSIRDVAEPLTNALRRRQAAAATRPLPATVAPPGQPTAEDATTALQKDLQDSMRDVFSQTAESHGVKPEPATSIRDVATNLSDAMQEKAKGIYKTLDEATGGGRFQRFEDQINNITKAIREITGIDPAREDALTERLNTVEKARDQALQEARNAGVDPSIIDDADRTFRQGKAIEDISNHVRKTTKGLRPEMTKEGIKTTPETVTADQLSNRLNNMYNEGTLQDPLGENRAQDLLRALDQAQVEGERIGRMAKPVEPPTKTGGRIEALEKFTEHIQHPDVTEGVRPEYVKPEVKATPETISPEQMFRRVTMMDNDGSLARMLPGRAQDLISEVDAAKLRMDKARTIRKIVKGAAIVGTGVAGAATAGAKGGKIIRNLENQSR